MSDDDEKQIEDDYKELRGKAERLIRRLTPDQDPSTLSPNKLRTIVHELQVYQTELEIQNEELRRAQRELEEARDKYADLYEFAPVGYFTFDRQGLILDVNLSGARLVNSERRSLLKTPFVALVSRDDISTFYSHLRRVFGASERQICEIKLNRRGNGDVFVRMESTTFQGNDTGGMESCRTAVSDITEIERVKEEVLRTHEHVLGSMLEGVSVTDQDGFLSYTNQAFSIMFGYQRADLAGKNLAEFGDCLDTESMATVLDVLGQLTAKGKWRGELRCRKRDGTLFDALVKATLLDLFDHKSLVFVWEDVTSLKRAEEALRTSEQRFRTIFESATDLIFIKDRSLSYTHVNPAFERLVGKPSAGIVGLTYEGVFGEAEAAYERDLDLRVLKGETIEEERSRTIGGAARRFHEVRVPLKDGQSNVIGLYGIARDITERAERLHPLPTPRPARYPSKSMSAAMHLALSAAKTDSIVLLKGETGSGKDYVARYIHDNSSRSGGPFYILNCGAVPEGLAESELFGHERGSFTGAHAKKRGLLELAEGGTLLLNEIGELSRLLQAKLLTFLDTRKVLRVGGEKAISINARLIAATNRDLDTEVEKGRFREDLLYRLSVMTIEIPPLRERLEDFPALVEEITSRLAADLQLANPPKIAPSMMDAFRQYHWPGNVRELRNVLERTLIVGDRPLLNFTERKSGSGGDDYKITVSFGPGRTLRDVTDEITHALVLEALRRSHGNKKEASRLLGIARDSLYRYLAQFEIEPESEG